jgi:DNA-binding beta-propeller fold protein YncE
MRRWLAVLPLVAALVACGGDRSHRAAEPAVSPASSGPISGREVKVGHVPEGIATDPTDGLVAVATRRPGTIVLLAASTGRVVARIPFPGEARHLEFVGSRGPLLIPSEAADRLFVLEPRSHRLSSLRVGHHPHAAAALGGRVFVTDELSGSVSVVQGGAVIARVTGFRQPGGVAATGNNVAVVDVGSFRLTLLGGGDLKPLASADAGQGPTHAVADGRGSVYVVDTRGNAIEQFATSPRLRLRARLRLPGTPYGVALDPVRGRLWVTQTALDQLAELRLGPAGPQVVASYATGRQPNTVAADPATGSVFVADAGDDAVQIIRPRG